MSKYIDMEALVAEFKRLELGENSFIERVFADGVYAIIEQFPAADVAQVVHGRWEEYLIPNILCCSNCDWGIDPLCKSPYCPNCGAKMNEKEAVYD